MEYCSEEVILRVHILKYDSIFGRLIPFEVSTRDNPYSVQLGGKANLL